MDRYACIGNINVSNRHRIKKESFRVIIKNPIPIFIGLVGQLIILPLIAIFIGFIIGLCPVYFAGLMLIALSPGGSSSNAFTLLAKGNVELSVLLTLLSSIITIITLPIAMKLVSFYLLSDTNIAVDMVGEKIILQNILLTIMPMLFGIILKKYILIKHNIYQNCYIKSYYLLSLFWYLFLFYNISGRYMIIS